MERVRQDRRTQDGLTKANGAIDQCGCVDVGRWSSCSWSLYFSSCRVMRPYRLKEDSTSTGEWAMPQSNPRNEREPDYRRGEQGTVGNGKWVYPTGRAGSRRRPKHPRRRITSKPKLAQRDVDRKVVELLSRIMGQAGNPGPEKRNICLDFRTPKNIRRG